jgi:protein-S-isoprenylcysteine O-methyltransferase Ste14
MSALLRRAAQLLVLALVQAVVLVACAGTLRWGAAWLYVGLYVGLIALASVVIVPRHPEVVAERSRGRAGAVGWDRAITTALIVPSLGILAVAGLQYRWSWPPAMPAWLVVCGVVLFVAGYAVVVATMAANPFFAQVVRIQTEREHVAVTGGPYRFVRHPGYAGMITSALGSVLLLGSAWALLPWACYVALVVVRTALEDRLLIEQLPGYADYTARTAFRLVPGVW